jgi:hypothetical protein
VTPVTKEKKIATPWNVSRRATAKVKDPMPAPEKCNCCGSEAIEIVENSAVYNGKTYGKYPWVYLCNDCRAYVGLHPFTNIPLGTLANEEMRAARKRAKSLFIELYESGDIIRDEAYARLAKKLGIDEAACHFAMFDVSLCERVEAACILIADEIANPPVRKVKRDGVFAAAFKKLGLW